VQALRTDGDAVEQRVRRRSFSVFQPMWGIFRLGSAGVMRSTSPAIQPSPSVTSYSRPRSAISCMPTQMPRNGRPRWRTLVERLDHAVDRVEAMAAIGEGADPGSTTRSARRTASGSLVTTIACANPCSRAARSNALAAECRLPEP
jgi:hypothetical protein